jgi:hypothetical protein
MKPLFREEQFASRALCERWLRNQTWPFSKIRDQKTGGDQDMKATNNGVPLDSRTEKAGSRNGLKQIALAAAAILAVTFTATSAYANCGPMAGVNSASIRLPVTAYASPQVEGQNAEQQDAIPSLGANHSIVGLWHVIYTADNSVFAETLKQWHSDGTEFENVDHNPAIGSVCLGVWKQVSVRTVRLHHVGWLFNVDGSPAGTFTQDETDTIARNGMSYTGTFTFRTYDVNGNFSGFEATGTIAATRITVD